MGLFTDIFANVATSLLGSLASGLVSSGLNAAFGAKPPSRNQVTRDIQSQAQALQGIQPVRTPEQVQADQLALKESQARADTFSKLSTEYDTAQKAGPANLWDPNKEQQIRLEAMADAAARGMGDSGQAQEMVNRRLQEYRLAQGATAGQQYETKLSNLRSQMLPYSNVQQPSTGTLQTPALSPIPRDVRPTFSASPVNITSGLDVKRTAEDDAKKKTGNAWTGESGIDEPWLQ